MGKMGRSMGGKGTCMPSDKGAPGRTTRIGTMKGTAISKEPTKEQKKGR